MSPSLTFSDATRIREEEPAGKPPGTSTKLGGFAAPQPRQLPVIVLADVSGSMAENQKIETLNQALKAMIESFAKESRLRAEIQVGLITFGINGAQEHLPLVAAHRIERVAALQASGPTPMGKAFTLVRQWLEDKQRVASRAYRPVLVLVSDGAPTDDWEGPLQALKNSERAQKATRFAMAIGADADTQMLAQFANDREAPVFEAEGARDIVRFFRAVTMSVVARSSSTTPDQAQGLRLAPDDLGDDLDLDDL